MAGQSVSAEEEFLTRREAAQLAGVHLNTIRLWESTGRVHTSKAPNGIVLIPRKEVEAIVDARRSSAQSDAERAAGAEAEARILREQLNELNERYERLLEQVLHLAEERQ